MTTPDRALEAQALLDKHRCTTARPSIGTHYIEAPVALAAVTEALGRGDEVTQAVLNVFQSRIEAWRVVRELDEEPRQLMHRSMSALEYDCVMLGKMLGIAPEVFNAAPQPSEDK